MKKTALLIGILLILGCSQLAEKESKSSIDWITDLAAAKTMAKSQGKPMLIDFYADWCSWCRRMDENTYKNLKVAELAKKFVCVKIDTDKQPDVAENYKVRGLPTTVFLSSEGKEIAAIPGYLPPEEFLKKMESALKAQ